MRLGFLIFLMHMTTRIEEDFSYTYFFNKNLGIFSFQNFCSSGRCRTFLASEQTSPHTPGPQTGKPFGRQNLHKNQTMRLRIGHLRDIQTKSWLVSYSNKICLFLKIFLSSIQHVNVASDRNRTRPTKVVSYKTSQEILVSCTTQILLVLYSSKPFGSETTSTWAAFSILWNEPGLKYLRM